MSKHEKKWTLARLTAAVGIAAALAAVPAQAFAEEAEGAALEGEGLELVAQDDNQATEVQTTEVQATEGQNVATPTVTDEVAAPTAVVVDDEDNSPSTDGTDTPATLVVTDDDATTDAVVSVTDDTELAAQDDPEPRKGHWVVSNAYGQGLQRYWVWDDDGSFATSELVGPENGAGYYAWATDKGYILRGKWDSGAGRVYVADNDGRLVGSLLEDDEDGWVVTDKFDKGSMQRYWVDAKTRAACSGFFTIADYGDCFGKGGQGYIVRGDFKFGGRLWSADNDGKLRSGWYVTSGFGHGLQRYWMGDTVYDSPHAAAVSRLVDASTSKKAWFAWATADGYVLRGKWDNGAGRVYVADNDGRLLGSDLTADGWVVTSDFDKGSMQRYRVDASMRAAISGFFTVADYGDCFGLGGQGYVLRGTKDFRDSVVLADNDGKLPSEAGWLVSKAYGQGLQRYWVEVIYKTYLGTKPGYSEEGWAHYTVAEGYVLRNGAIAVGGGKGYKADNDGHAEEIQLGWFQLANGHWFYLSADERAYFENDIDEKGNDLGHYDVLHDIWLKVNGYVSGSHQSYLSRTQYLICTSWTACYVGVFVGTPNSTKADNWEPLFGWNCGNGSAAVIERKVKEKNPSSTWKWDPNWDKFLAEANVSSNVPEFEDHDKWAAKLDTTWAGSRRASVNANEKWFTSLSWTLGFHTTITGNPSNEIGRHVSNGCIRLSTEHAKWIYDNIGPGTRCLQMTEAKLKSK